MQARRNYNRTTRINEEIRKDQLYSAESAEGPENRYLDVRGKGRYNKGFKNTVNSLSACWETTKREARPRWRSKARRDSFAGSWRLGSICAIRRS